LREEIECFKQDPSDSAYGEHHSEQYDISAYEYTHQALGYIALF